MRAFRIYCGRGRSNGRPVSETELRAFINRSVRPRFDAFTVQRVQGYWRDTSEPSFIIEIVNASRSTHARIRDVAADYKRRFGQEAVLIVGNDVESALL